LEHGGYSHADGKLQFGRCDANGPRANSAISLQITVVHGIDARWIGRFDLSTSLRISSQLDHRVFQEATQKVVEACRRHSKIAVLGVSDPKLLARGPADGFHMFVYLTGTWIYQKALRDYFGVTRNTLNGRDEHHYLWLKRLPVDARTWRYTL
jgi:hypothetical protein